MDQEDGELVIDEGVESLSAASTCSTTAVSGFSCPVQKYPFIRPPSSEHRRCSGFGSNIAKRTNGNHSLCAEQKIYDNRILSFTSWPKCHPLRPEALAKAGFYYTNKGDICRCAWCGITLTQWESFDCAVQEHKKYSVLFFLQMVYPSQ